ncbi:MAG: hypothetical protein WCW67_03070 [Candidatus Margulisiibacteriota bacterium]
MLPRIAELNAETCGSIAAVSGGSKKEFNMNEQKSLYDVLIVLIQMGMPVVTAAFGFLIGKWWDDKTKKNDFKREILFKANRGLSRFVYFYITSFAYRDNNNEFEKEYEQETSQFDEIKADLEIFVGINVYNIFLECASCAKLCGEEAYERIRKGEFVTKQEELINFKAYSISHYKWIQAVRDELKIRD